MEAAALEAALAAAVRCARGFGRGFAEGFVRGGDAVLSYSRPCARAAAAVARAHAASLYWCVLHGVPFEERAPVVVHVPADEDEAKAMPPAVAAHFAGRSHVERVHAQLVATHAVEEQPVVRKAELPQRPYHAAVARFVCAWAAKGELPLVPLACAPMAADMLIEESTGECLRRLQVNPLWELLVTRGLQQTSNYLLQTPDGCFVADRSARRWWWRWRASGRVQAIRGSWRSSFSRRLGRGASSPYSASATPSEYGKHFALNLLQGLGGRGAAEPVGASAGVLCAASAVDICAADGGRPRTVQAQPQVARRLVGRRRCRPRGREERARNTHARRARAALPGVGQRPHAPARHPGLRGPQRARLRRALGLCRALR
eukprot:TRINITY_DN3702_c0_g1_i3.p1 TRINITY_DN3702_c0_g1~~TRINITY_DN3702_c0_g1_i3.p1  ORF type:complete len:390 (+),score=33.40 TRINITY_DN3702_c0_g1_i3:50-1171(+)